MWEQDFKKLSKAPVSLSLQEVMDIVIISQIEKNQQFYVRPLKLVENLEMLQTMVKERPKLMPILRAQFKQDVKKLEQAGYSW